MDGEELNFRKKSTHAATMTSSEGRDSPKLSHDIVKKKESNSNQITSKSETARKVGNLFSMALAEYRDLRNSSISLRECGIRSEEICDILRLKVMAILEETNDEHKI